MFTATSTGHSRTSSLWREIFRSPNVGSPILDYIRQSGRSRHMRLGFSLPTFGPAAKEMNGIARFAADAEKLGATSLWVGDRLLTPVDPTVGYTPDSPAIPDEFRVAADPLTALALAAAVTGEVRLGSSGINAPWYSPALLARALTSVDVASGGRLTAGFGSGWSPEEYEAAGVPFAGRGARLDEFLDVLLAWWTAGPVEHRGPLFTIPAGHVDLKPVQRPHPPIYLGAFGRRALRRIGERADGWMPVWWAPEAFPAARLTEGWATIRRAAEEAGRDPDSIGSILRVNVAAGTPVSVVAEEVRKIGSVLPAEDLFVDFTFVARSVDHTIDLAGRLLELVSAG
ncbi:TIGR03619 family F420-dependent LLM class oxidoreductase [Streptomyces griseorubiginosus]|uniref:TIGR03619 family F420-dependent LLM class oxidoreductase n=1 Tax=Streptomyces griseorubiginosus TaxID=67304 RepID=UPI001FCAAEFC|nr:TIGR03619 family F420-dependent LLM class oxidoreductase [Streptomyces griseorubiginosus]